jgi:predicted outer membrane repeat protein
MGGNVGNSGGAIFAGGTVTLTGAVTLSNNVGNASGGGIVSGGNVLIDGSLIAYSNQALNGGQGGAIYAAAGTITTTGSVDAEKNYASVGGGAFSASNGAITLASADGDVSLIGNIAGGNGGAIATYGVGTAGAITIGNGTGAIIITDNKNGSNAAGVPITSGFVGGALATLGNATVTLKGSTIDLSRNTSVGGNGAPGLGGGGGVADLVIQIDGVGDCHVFVATERDVAAGGIQKQLRANPERATQSGSSTVVFERHIAGRVQRQDAVVAAADQTGGGINSAATSSAIAFRIHPASDCDLTRRVNAAANARQRNVVRHGNGRGGRQ